VAWDNQPSIAVRCARANFVALKQNRIDASLSQKISHTDSDDSATDNDDIRPFHSLSPSLQRLNGEAYLPHKYNELCSPTSKIFATLFQNSKRQGGAGAKVHRAFQLDN
jgi:hypothetical protein